MNEDQELVFRINRLIQTVNSYRVPLHQCATKHADIRQLLRQIDKEQRFILGRAKIPSSPASVSTPSLMRLANLMVLLRNLFNDSRVEQEIEEWEASSVPLNSTDDRLQTNGKPGHRRMKMR
jgi:hypothetical protein